MFGYVLPYTPNLRVFENEIYKATYCGLCKEIKRNFGSFCRLTLSYDMVFLVIFFTYYLEEKMEFEKSVCKLHPFKKRLILKESNSLKKAAIIGTILSHYKLTDNVSDCKKLKRMLNLIFLFFYKRAYKKAKKSEQKIEEIVFNFIRDQAEVEKKRNKSLDFYSHPTADCIGNIFKTVKKDEKDEATLYRIGYMLGKYIYLMDALDDMEKDSKSNNFNPFLEDKDRKEDILKKSDMLINFSVAQLAEAFEKLFRGKEVLILKNIIYEGLKKGKEKILKKIKKTS